MIDGDVRLSASHCHPWHWVPAFPAGTTAGGIDIRAAVRDALSAARGYAADRLALVAKEPVLVGRNGHGLSLCGYRILPGRLLLSRRRKRRYAECRSSGRAFAATV